MCMAKATRESTYGRMPTHRGPRAQHDISEQEAERCLGNPGDPSMTGHEVQTCIQEFIFKMLVHAYSEVRSSNKSVEVR